MPDGLTSRRRYASRSACGALLLAAVSGCAGLRAPASTAWWLGFEDADTVRVTPLIDGVRHTYLWLPRGPWAVHVLEIDERVCLPVLAALKAGPPLDARAATTELGEVAIAAVNADFFQEPGGTPVGAHVHAGRVLVGPGARPLYALGVDGAHWAGPGRLAGGAAVGDDRAPISQVNRPLDGGRHQPPRPGLTLFDEWFGAASPGTGNAVRVRRLEEPAAPGAARGVVVARYEDGAPAALDSAHVVLQPVGEEAAGWLERRTVGDTVRWSLAVVPLADTLTAGAAAAAAAEAVGGFPLLVVAGRGVYGEQEGVIASFGPARHPRTAVGRDAVTRRMLWIVVDGRQPPYSDGMSLPELEWLLLRLGATDAINLDGGGSSALAVAGRLANRPSDDAGERPVANVLALEGCR